MDLFCECTMEEVQNQSKMFDVKIVLLLRSVFGFCFVCVEDYVSCTQLIQPVQLLEANA